MEQQQEHLETQIAENELLREIKETYQEVYERTNELLDLLEVYLEHSIFRYVRQQNIVRLQVIIDILNEAKEDPTLRHIHAKNL